jgi:hypothetical protein
LHGVQGVASSNPAAPTIEETAKAQHRKMLGLLLSLGFVAQIVQQRLVD